MDKTTPELIVWLREANPAAIRQRLDELDAEAAELRSLLRSIHARERARQSTPPRQEVRRD